MNGWSAVSNNGDPMDDKGHGTHVTKTIDAVSNNGSGVSGIAWNINYCPAQAPCGK